MKQTDLSDSSPVGVTNTHLDSKGYYFANGINIIPGQNMPLDSITKEQAQDILKSEIINYINAEDLVVLQKIVSQPVSKVPVPTRIGQILTSKVVNNKLVIVWEDAANVPSTSSEFIPQPNSNTENTDATGLFTRLINATYVAINKHVLTNQLTPNDTSKPYGGDLSSYEISFSFKFNLQNDSVTFKTLTGVDIVFKNNFDGTITVIDGSQELITLNHTEDGVFQISNGRDLYDVSIGYNQNNGYTQIKPWETELAGGRRFTSITINGNASVVFYTPEST